MKKTAIIMLNWNGLDDTVAALNSIKEFAVKEDIYLVDNASKDNEYDLLINRARQIFGEEKVLTYNLEELEKYREIVAFSDEERICIIQSENNLGFAGANNFVSSLICHHYETITLLNNDVELTGDVFDSMYKVMKAENCTAITCDIRYYFDKKTLWNAGGSFRWYGDRKYFSQNEIDKLKAKGISFIFADFVTGCCLMIDSSYIKDNGLFTDKFFHGEEDFNFCKRLKNKGLKCGVVLDAIIYHKVGRSLNFSKNDKRNLNKIVVHYTNRIIDMKSFYGKVRWNLWYRFYIFMFSIKAILRKQSLSEVAYIAKQTKKYANKNDVKAETYQEIMNDNV